MVDLTTLHQEYEAKLPLFRQLEEEASFALRHRLKERGIRIDSGLSTSRVKSPESFIEKVQRKDAKKPFEEIQDTVGLRVVCLLLSEIEQIGEEIHEAFEVLSEDDKIEGEQYDVSSFGYMSVHFIARMKKEYKGPRYESILGLPFEIQVRTIAMHAWATISHHLLYKNELDVPRQLRHHFHALSGLFYVADTHFETFFKQSQTSRTDLVRAFEQAKPAHDQEINLDSLAAYLHAKLPDRETRPESYSELITELGRSGYTSIDDIEHAVDIGWDAFVLWEKEDPPSNAPRFADVGVIRGLFDLLDEEYMQRRGSQAELEKYRKLIKAEKAITPDRTG